MFKKFNFQPFRVQKVTKFLSFTKPNLQTFLACVQKNFCFIKIWVKAWFYKNEFEKYMEIDVFSIFLFESLEKNKVRGGSWISSWFTF